MVANLVLPQPTDLGDEWGNALNAGIMGVNSDVEALKGRQIVAGNGLLGGGPLTGNIALSLDLTAVVTPDDPRLTDARTPVAHSHAQGDVTGLTTALSGKAPTTRTISAGNGLTGGGDLSANRTLAVDFPAAATEVARSPGTAALGTSSKVARIDHVHPIPTAEIGTIGPGSGWTLGSLASLRRRGGIATLIVDIGRDSQSGTGAANTTAASLPVGWRPLSRMYMTGLDTGSGGDCAMYLDTDGGLKFVFGRPAGSGSVGFFTYVCDQT